MVTFSEAPLGDGKAGEKIFKMKCTQCHIVDKGVGIEQRSREGAALLDYVGLNALSWEKNATTGKESI